MNLQNLMNELEHTFGKDTTQWPELMTNKEFLKIFHIVSATSYRLRSHIYRILDSHRPMLEDALPRAIYTHLLVALLYDATYNEQRFRHKLKEHQIPEEWHDTIINIVHQPPQIRSVLLRRKVLVYKEDVKKLFPHQWKYHFGRKK